jgi:integrase
MSRRKLTDARCRTLRSGTHADGNGLYLEVNKTGSRRWLFRWTDKRGKPAKMAIGRYDRGMSLVEARERVDRLQALLTAGEDPRSSKGDKKRKKTFGEAAERFIENLIPTLRNDKHIAQWCSTILGSQGKTAVRGDDYCATLRAIPVEDVSTSDVVAVLQPIWLSRPETAKRIQGRIERILDASTAIGERTGENPARWKGHLDKILPKQSNRGQSHHASLAYSQIPNFLKELRIRQGIAAMALEFLILTAARSGEVRELRWNELSLEQKTWTVPASRMKAGREHKVPLSDGAMRVLEQMASDSLEGLVFPGQRRGRPMSDMTLSAVLKRMNMDCTVHGFRSTFRDWAAERTNASFEAVEQSLAHTIGDRTVRAYFRTNLFDQRRDLMNEWCSYCLGAH